MNEKLNLEKIEQKTWEIHFQHGLSEIFLGTMALIFSARYIAPYLVLLIFIIPIPYFILRKIFISPRIGKVKFGHIRKKKLMQYNVVAIIVVFMMFFLMILLRQNFSNEVRTIIMMIFTIAAFTLIGYTLDYLIFSVYGIIISLPYALMEILGPPLGPLFMFISSFILLIIGGFKLSEFIYKYPLNKAESPHEY